MNISTSEYSSGCESGWTMYLDQSSNSAHQYPKSVDENYKSKGPNVDYEEEDEEDQDLSMVSDASSGPPHFHEDEDCIYDNGYFGYAASASASQQINKSTHKKKVKEQKGKQPNSSYLDDTASSPVFSYSKASMEHGTQGYSATHVKGKSALQKHFGFLKPSVSNKSASEKSGGLQGRKWQ